MRHRNRATPVCGMSGGARLVGAAGASPPFSCTACSSAGAAAPFTGWRSGVSAMILQWQLKFWTERKRWGCARGSCCLRDEKWQIDCHLCSKKARQAPVNRCLHSSDGDLHASVMVAAIPCDGDLHAHVKETPGHPPPHCNGHRRRCAEFMPKDGGIAGLGITFRRPVLSTTSSQNHTTQTFSVAAI